MAINFPNSPSDGDTHTAGGKTFTYDATAGLWNPSGSGVTEFTGLSDTPSALGTAGQIAKVNSGATALEFADQSGVTVYATADLLPGTANAGDMAFVSATNRLYLWNGSGWYNIALINTNPSISGVSSSYALATDGTATTVTITATDPEGVPITYSIVSDTSGNIATVSQGTGSNSNVFTITPSTNNANGGSFILTFRASDGVNIASSVSTFTLSFSVPNSKYTSALITSVGANNAVNNSFTDSSGNSHAITSSGGVSQGTFSPFRQNGYSWYFNGTTDYLQVPDSSTLDLPADFTIEFWMYREADTSGTYQSILGGNGSTSNGWNFYVTNSNNVLSFFHSSFLITGPAIEDQRWYHVALTRSGTTLTMYVDGTSVGTATTSTSFDQSTANTGTRIGYDNGANGYFHGYLTDVRVVQGTAVYTAAFTPPAERLTAVANTSLLLGDLPYLADGSTNNHKLTSNGTPSMEPFTPYDNVEEYTAADHDAGISFNGTDSRVQADTAVDAFTTAGTAWTIEAWVYPRDLGGSNAGATNWVSANRASDGHYVFAIGPKQITLDNVYETNLTDMAVNQWHHIAAVNSGGYMGLKYFINGYHVNSYNPSASAPALDVSRFVLGASLVGATVAYNHFDGVLSNVRVSDTNLYTNSDYTPTNPPTQTFTPPTAPFTTDNNTDFLLYGRNGAIIDKSQSVSAVVLNGDVKSSTTQTKYLSSSMYFDGTGDSISLTPGYDDPIYSFGTHDWTLEGWFYIQTLSSGRNLFSFLRASTNEAVPHIYTQGTDVRYYVLGVDRIIGTSALTLNTWHHIAVTRSGNDHKLFVDGTQVGSTWTSAQTYVQGRPVLGDYHSSLGTLTNGTNLLHGYAEDFRITKGLARYTANFTPPTAALQG